MITVKFKDYFNQYNPKGSEHEVLAISLNNQTYSGVSFKIRTKNKQGIEADRWIDSQWFDITQFKSEKEEDVFIPLK